MAAKPSIEVTTREDLSVLYRILRTVIRPFRPRLVAAGEAFPAGSLKLSPPSTKCAIHERQSEGLYLYDFIADTNPPDQKPSTVHHLYYFGGGGFQSPPSSNHWKLCTELCLQLTDSYRITLVSYPLSPNSPAPESLLVLQKWLRATIHQASSNPSSVTLMGDSSGWNIAISLGFWWASNGSDNTVGRTLKNVLVISPATDLRNTNPEIKEADRYDPVLTIKASTDGHKKWAGTMPLDNVNLSPIFSDPNLFRLRKIKVHGVVGTHDILAPDALKFRKACSEAGVTGEWLEWKGQMHCFPLAFTYGLREAKEGKDWIVDVLRRNV